MADFVNVGRWWNDRDIELVEIEGEVYALHGWNGESYMDSWKCIGEDERQASEEQYHITPIYKETGDDEFDVVSYKVIQG